MDVDLRSLRAFVTVADLGSFSQAAAVLNISQSALSRRIQTLELVLNVSLFKRSTRRVALTVVGRQFLVRTREVLNELDASLLSMRDLSKRHVREIRVACIPSAARYLLPGLIRKYSGEYPGIRIRILDDSADAITQYVIDKKVDFGINIKTTPEVGLEFETLETEPYLLACHRDHPLARKTEVEWADLEPSQFISVGIISGARLLLEVGQQSVTGLINVPWPKWCYEVNNVATALSLIEAGLGVAVLPRMAIRHYHYPSVTSRPLIKPTLTRAIGIIRLRDIPTSPAAQRFSEMLKTLCATSDAQ